MTLNDFQIVIGTAWLYLPPTFLWAFCSFIYLYILLYLNLLVITQKMILSSSNFNHLMMKLQVKYKLTYSKNPDSELESRYHW